MAKPARELRTMEPMVENYRREPGLFRVIINDHPAVFMWQRTLLFYPAAGTGKYNAAKGKDKNAQKEQLFHGTS